MTDDILAKIEADTLKFKAIVQNVADNIILPALLNSDQQSQL